MGCAYLTRKRLRGWLCRDFVLKLHTFTTMKKHYPRWPPCELAGLKVQFETSKAIDDPFTCTCICLKSR